MGHIKLLIVDDHPLFRQGLVDVLETDPAMQVVGQAADGAVAIAQAREFKPDVVLMDVNLPNANGLEITKQITDELPDTKVVILTGYDESAHVHQALEMGAVAYCTKDVPPDALLNLIRSVCEGLYFIDGQVLTVEEAEAWLGERAVAQGGWEGVPMVHLSPREREILELVAQGASNKEIAFRLNISQQTVKNHMTAVLRKLRVEDRTQAAVTALRNGWVRLDSQIR